MKQVLERGKGNIRNTLYLMQIEGVSWLKNYPGLVVEYIPERPDFLIGEKTVNSHNNCSRSFILQSEKNVLRLIYHVIKGLQYLHSLNVVHGSLSPEKIFLSPEGYAKIGVPSFHRKLGGKKNIKFCAPEGKLISFYR